METLEIQEGKYTPEVIMRDGYISIKGNSYPSNTETFYKPIIGWINKYVNNAPELTEIHLKFEHMDSPTVKSVYEILKHFKVLNGNGSTKAKAEIIWYHDRRDDETLDKGMLISEHLKLPFKFVQY